MLSLVRYEAGVISQKVFRKFSTSLSTKPTNSFLIKPRFDYKSIRDQRELLKKNVEERNAQKSADVDLVISLYEAHTSKKQEADLKRARRNEIAQQLSVSGPKKESLIAESKKLKDELSRLEVEESSLEDKLMTEASKLPNVTHPNSPRQGQDPTVLQTIGHPPNFSFTPQTHMELGKNHSLIHFPSTFGASKFYYGKGDVALLETALVNWAMVNVASKYGFTPLTTPDLIAVPFAEACGFQPRSEATQMYSVANSDLCLVGTQEIPLASLYCDSIIPEEDLPIKMVAYGHCFRHEIGTNSESRGLYRVHQFTKVEMFIICKPEDSEKYHQELLDIEIQMLKDLGLHFKVMDMPTDDLGAAAYRKFDIEAWMPYKEGYGEVTSCSNCLDYQSRRLNMRFRGRDLDVPPRFVHTLNATALAVPRVTLALLENGQNEDQSIKVPEVLVPFMGGRTVLNPKKIDSSRSL